MNYKTIAVCGIGNVGKTTSINYAVNKIYNRLRQLHQDTYIEKSEGYSSQSTDKCYVIVSNSKRIGVITRGDGEYWINKGLECVGKCDFYICASHLFGETVDCLLSKKDLFLNDEIIFLNKPGLFGKSIKWDSNNQDIVSDINNDNKSFSNLLADLFFKMLWFE